MSDASILDWKRAPYAQQAAEMSARILAARSGVVAAPAPHTQAVAASKLADGIEVAQALKNAPTATPEAAAHDDEPEWLVIFASIPFRALLVLYYWGIVGDRPTADKIAKAVGARRGVPWARILDGARERVIVRARHEAMWLACHMLFRNSFTQIGMEFNAADHTTVRNAVARFEDRLRAWDVFL